MSEPFLLGVNYWPRQKAMYWWSDFDAAEVQADFALIRDLGMQIVRIFLLWDDFQPALDVIAPAPLRHLETVCDLAAQHNLQLDITFFTGHMSGPNWCPRWLLDPALPAPRYGKIVSKGEIVSQSYRNFYLEPDVWEAQKLQLRTVVSRLKDHPAVWMWNLGNEPTWFALPPSRAIGRQWMTEMTNTIKEIDPLHPVTCGLDMASLTTNFAIPVHDAYGITDVAVMHTYPMYTAWARNPLDADLVAYSCALTQALCGKPVLMEEFGSPLVEGESEVWKWEAYGEPREQFMASETDFADFIAAVLPKLVEVGATGAFLWCFADYIPELYDKPPCRDSWHERHFGLVRYDGSLRPHAEVIREFAALNPQTLAEPSKTVALDLSVDDYFKKPAEHSQRLYKIFLGEDPNPPADPTPEA